MRLKWPRLSVGLAVLLFATGCASPLSKDAQTSKLLPSKRTASKTSKTLDNKFNLAKVREQEGEFTKALQLYQELCTADPQNAAYFHRLGVVRCRIGKFDDGMEALRTADALKPDDIHILNDLGYATLMVGKFDLAEQVFASVLEIDPQDTRALNNLGLAIGLSGRYDESYAMFRRIMTEPEALANLGYVATQSGNRDFAIDCYSRALRLDPDLKSAGEALAQLADIDRQVAQRQSIARASQGKGTIQQVGYRR